MRIRYLGHAGFDVRNARDNRLVCDPWLSPGGAFLGSWFQFPRNHHLFDSVLDLHPERDVLYLSHHHRDHFDRALLRQLDRDLPLCVPRFVRRHFVNELKAIGFRDIRELRTGERIDIRGFRLTMTVDDCYANEDSGILIECDGTKFLNMNDCRAYDRISEASLQPLDLFTIQFSGASWYPSVYTYSLNGCDEHSRIKNDRKFRNVRKLIDRLRPRLYVPSAGPPCFLDPTLRPFNFGNPSPFPDAKQLRAALEGSDCRFDYIFPGDMITLFPGREPEVAALSGLDESLYDPAEKTEYIRRYGDQVAGQYEYSGEGGDAWPELLRAAREKVASLSAGLPVPRALVFSLEEHPTLPDRHVLIDLQQRTAEPAEPPFPPDVYQYSFTNSVMTKFFRDGELWEDLMLSLRLQIHRSPDEFDPLIADFVRLQNSDLSRYPFTFRSEERIRKVVDGVEYEFDRYCPHNNGDLLNAEIVDGRVICPRHGWQFDLRRQGDCTDNHCTLNARPTTPASGN